MTAKTLRKNENYSLELIEVEFGYELWSNHDDFHGYAERLLDWFDDLDSANQAFSNAEFERGQARIAQGEA